MSRKKGNITKKAAAFPATPSGSITYFFARAIANVRQNLLVSLLTVGTISLSFLLLSLFLLVYVNLEGAADRWSEKVQVTVYFDAEPPQSDVSMMQTRVLSLPGTDRVSYVSKAEAMQRFRSRLKGQEALLEGVGNEVLPASLEIRLKKGYRTTENIEKYVSALRKVPGVSEVQYGEEWVRRFNTFMTFMRFVGALLGGFLILAVLFIVSNTIRLTIYSRREELEVMQMVGAASFFIKSPFLIEGTFQGIAGAVLALSGLGAFYLAFLHNAGNFLNLNVGSAGLAFLPPAYLLVIVAGGATVGFIGSLASLRRFM